MLLLEKTLQKLDNVYTITYLNLIIKNERQLNRWCREHSTARILNEAKYDKSRTKTLDLYSIDCLYFNIVSNTVELLYQVTNTIISGMYYNGKTLLKGKYIPSLLNCSAYVVNNDLLKLHIYHFYNLESAAIFAKENNYILEFDKSSETLFFIQKDSRLGSHYKASLSNFEVIPPNTTDIKSYNQPDLAKNYEANETNSAFVTIENLSKECNKDAIKNIFNISINQEAFSKIAPIFGNFTFGLEYEVSRGNIPLYALPYLKLVPVIDGSVNREVFSEYPSLPLKLSNTEDFTKFCAQSYLLNQLCHVNSNCALHIHTGNLPQNYKFLVKLYTLLLKIQQEVFEFVHLYKRNEPASLGKNKNYSQPLDNLMLEDDIANKNFSEAAKKIVKYYTTMSFQPFKENRYNVPWGRKWTCTTRYKWINMINYLLRISGSNTIENRIPLPTLKLNDTLFWVFMISAILNYTKSEHSDLTILDENHHIKLQNIINWQFKDCPILKQINRELKTYIKTHKIDNLDLINSTYSKGMGRNSFHVECEYGTDIREILNQANKSNNGGGLVQILLNHNILKYNEK